MRLSIGVKIVSKERKRFVFLSTINVNFGWKTGSKRSGNFEFVEGYDRSGFV